MLVTNILENKILPHFDTLSQNSIFKLKLCTFKICLKDLSFNASSVLLLQIKKVSTN